MVPFLGLKLENLLPGHIALRFLWRSSPSGMSS